MPKTPDQAYPELIQRFKEYSLIASCASVLGWDERTYMPREGAASRAEQMALLARLAHESLTAPRMGRLLNEIEGSALVQDAENAPAVNVREIRRVYNRAVKIPKTLVEELARTT